MYDKRPIYNFKNLNSTCSNTDKCSETDIQQLECHQNTQSHWECFVGDFLWKIAGADDIP